MTLFFKNLNLNTWISFLLFGGTPIIMLLVFYFMGFTNSYLFVVLTKLFLFFSVIIYFLKSNLEFKKCKLVLLFTFFWLLWFIRVFYDSYFNFTIKLMLNTYNYYLFSFFFAILPFFYGNLSKDDNSIHNVLKGLIISNVLFSLTVLLLFYNVLSNVHRLSSEDSSINPLAISYIASMNVGYFIWKNIVDRFSWFNLLIIELNIPIIGLGASKGGIIALVLSLLIVLFVIKKINFNFFLVLVTSYLVVINASFFFLDTVVDRFQYSIEGNTSGEKELRYYLWKYSFEKFIDNPFFGYFTEIHLGQISMMESSSYPHNIILESFLSMGIFGGFLMLSILIISLKNAIRISKKNADESWILLLFLIVFYQCMFSGNIYSGAIWFWFFVGLINGRFLFLKKQLNIN